MHSKKMKDSYSPKLGTFQVCHYLPSIRDFLYFIILITNPKNWKSNLSKKKKNKKDWLYIVCAKNQKASVKALVQVDEWILTKFAYAWILLSKSIWKTAHFDANFMKIRVVVLQILQ